MHLDETNFCIIMAINNLWVQKEKVRACNYSYVISIRKFPSFVRISYDKLVARNLSIENLDDLLTFVVHLILHMHYLHCEPMEWHY